MPNKVSGGGRLRRAPGALGRRLVGVLAAVHGRIAVVAAVVVPVPAADVAAAGLRPDLIAR